MINERISYLVRQFIDKHISEAELHELSAMLLENEDNSSFQLVVENLIRESSPAEAYNEQEWEPVYQQIVGAAERTKPPVYKIPFPRRGWVRYAAAVIIVLGAGIYVWMHNSTTLPAHQQSAVVNRQPVIAPGRNRAMLTLANGQQVVLDSAQGNIVQEGQLKVVNRDGKLDYEGTGAIAEYHTLSTPNGGQYKLTLPDGTNIWLNAASSVRYPTTFTGKERSVVITGEAYLEVAKDKVHPFVVHANGTEVRVLGTTFNINAYAEDNILKTTLVEGSVQIKREEGNGQPEMLKPGEQAQVTGNQIAIVHNADVEQALAWKNGLFNFNGLGLHAVMKQLERWYDIQVKYEGTVAEIKFHGKMDRGVNLPDILEILTKMELKYRMEGRTLTITP
jgi:ferric-dicitrate binding protein FerR (iron transport regulator)